MAIKTFVGQTEHYGSNIMYMAWSDINYCINNINSVSVITSNTICLFKSVLAELQISWNVSTFRTQMRKCSGKMTGLAECRAPSWLCMMGEKTSTERHIVNKDLGRLAFSSSLGQRVMLVWHYLSRLDFRDIQQESQTAGPPCLHWWIDKSSMLLANLWPIVHVLRSYW